MRKFACLVGMPLLCLLFSFCADGKKEAQGKAHYKTLTVSKKDVTLEQIKRTIIEWQEAVVGLDRMVYNDARKEFDLNSQTGFGVDGDRRQAQADFEEVRGSFESNSFVKAVLEHIEKKSNLGNKVLEKLNNVRG